MVISEEELKEMIKEPDAGIEKFTTLSDDGRNLLTRVPKEIVDFLKLKKGDKVRWYAKADTKELKVEIINAAK